MSELEPTPSALDGGDIRALEERLAAERARASASADRATETAQRIVTSRDSGSRKFRVPKSVRLDALPAPAPAPRYTNGTNGTAAHRNGTAPAHDPLPT